MVLYRSIVLGLVAALVMLELGRWQRPSTHPASPTIVDVSRAALASGADVAPVLGLHPGERIAAIDDTPVRDGGAVISAIRDAHAGQYVDLDVRRAGAARRVLVLIH
jgi:S1-C subfamily serine protease